ncbi:MAG: YeeE/YedE family protein, partial [Hyphomicrobiaceae bacterium]
IGIVFGYVVYRTNFCTMGAISDFVNLGDWRRFRAWILSTAIAIIGVQVLVATGALPLGKTMYLAPSLNWLGNILGGVLFGYGMVFAGGCASRNLTRIGGGDLRSVVTLLVMALFAFVAIGGLLGPIRAWAEQLTSINLAFLGVTTQSVGDIVGVVTRVGVRTGNMIVAAALVAAAFVYCFKDQEFRSSPIHIISGVAIGLIVTAGWALTGLAFDELAEKTVAPISLTYVRPTADAFDWLQRFTAGRMPGFGVTTVFGAIIGAFVAAKSMGRFKWESFGSVPEMKRNMMGSALMGVGGVLALGCTVGQAITGASTLALGSFLTFAGIVWGGVRGMKKMEAIMMDEV